MCISSKRRVGVRSLGRQRFLVYTALSRACGRGTLGSMCNINVYKKRGCGCRHERTRAAAASRTPAADPAPPPADRDAGRPPRTPTPASRRTLDSALRSGKTRGQARRAHARRAATPAALALSLLGLRESVRVSQIRALLALAGAQRPADSRAPTKRTYRRHGCVSKRRMSASGGAGARPRARRASVAAGRPHVDVDGAGVRGPRRRPPRRRPPRRRRVGGRTCEEHDARGVTDPTAALMRRRTRCQGVEEDSSRGRLLLVRESEVCDRL